MEPKMTPLIPVKQVFIAFAGYEFLAVQLPDGRIAVVFRHLCEALNLNFVGQLQRIQRNPMLSQHLLLVLIQTPGGPQVVNALSVLALSLWLGGFHITRLSEKKRALIIQLQDDAVAAFSRPFQFSETKEQPHAAPPKQEPTAQPPQAAPATASVPELLRALAGVALALAERVEQEGAKPEQGNQQLEDRVASLEQDNQRLEGQLASQDRQHQKDVAWLDRQYHEVLPLLAEANHRMQLQAEQIEVLWSVVWGRASASEEALSADQLHTLDLLLHYHQKATGQPLSLTRREMLELVGAADLPTLQQRDWKQILAWFRQRLEQNL